MTVRARIIAIGNSQGIRIPKLLLEQTGIQGDVELEVVEDKIIIHGSAEVRRGWDEAFQKMAEKGDDALLDSDQTDHSWDEEEWVW